MLERKLVPGRQSLDESEARLWPVVHPNELGRSEPISICWSPIVACNLHCPHCLDDKTVAQGASDLRVHIAQLIGRTKILGVDISGGEPLLVPELPRLLEHLVGAGLVVSITTNGWWLERRAPELDGKVDAVRVSLDGPDAMSHDRWRGKGSFARAISGLRLAIKLAIPVQVQTVAMRSTVSRLQEVVNVAAAEGANGVTILQMLPIGEGVALASQELLSDLEVEDVVAQITASDLHVRLRKRESAAGFTVVRADGSIWRNQDDAMSIGRRRFLMAPGDLLLLNELDGSA